MKKYFLLALIILLIVIAVFYFDNNKQDDFGWSTYKNERYGIKFVYPVHWNLRQSQALADSNPQQERNFAQISVDNGRDSENDLVCPSGFAGLTFQVGKLRNNSQSFEKFIESAPEFELGGRDKWGPVNLITIGEYQAFKVERIVDREYQCNGPLYFLEQDGSHYTTIGAAIGLSNPADRRIVEEILNSIELSPREF